eukprot:1157325-Pelagomonas_calceolata.AAC.15
MGLHSPKQLPRVLNKVTQMQRCSNYFTWIHTHIHRHARTNAHTTYLLHRQLYRLHEVQVLWEVQAKPVHPSTRIRLPHPCLSSGLLKGSSRLGCEHWRRLIGVAVMSRSSGEGGWAQGLYQRAHTPHASEAVCKACDLCAQRGVA